MYVPVLCEVVNAKKQIHIYVEYYLKLNRTLLHISIPKLPLKYTKQLYIRVYKEIFSTLIKYRTICIIYIIYYKEKIYDFLKLTFSNNYIYPYYIKYVIKLKNIPLPYLTVHGDWQMKFLLPPPPLTLY